MTNTSAIVQNLWNNWNVIHDDGMPTVIRKGKRIRIAASIFKSSEEFLCE